MSLFIKPTPEDVRFKALFYGDTGTGKTWNALQFPGPIALIDCDFGSDHYMKYREDIVRIKTTDLVLMNRAIDELIEDPQGIRTLVFDGLSNYTSLLQDAILKRLRIKKGKSDYTLQPLTYAVAI